MRMINKTKKWICIISIIILIIITLFMGFYYFNNNDKYNDPQSGEGPGRGMGGFWAQNYILLAILTATIIIIILASYYMISKNVKKHLNENMKLISQIVNTKNYDNQYEYKDTKNYYKTAFLKFLNYNENKVMKRLIENNGTILQSEISRMPGIGKVKAHRILTDMKIKGIVTLEKYGKTNRIILSEDLKKIFLK